MRMNRKKELEHKKKELHEDAFVTYVQVAWHKISGVLNYVIAGAVALLLIIGIMAVVKHQRTTEADKGWAALWAAEDRVNEANKGTTEEEQAKKDDATVAELQKLSKEIGGSSAHPAVLFYEANSLFKKGGDENLKAAEQACRRFTELYPDNYFALPMKQLLAKALFEQKQCDKALPIFKEVENSVRSGKAGKMPALQYEARYHIGRCQQLLGQKDDARKTYEDLARENTASPFWSEMADFQLKKMNS